MSTYADYDTKIFSVTLLMTAALKCALFPKSHIFSVKIIYSVILEPSSDDYSTAIKFVQYYCKSTECNIVPFANYAYCQLVI